MKKNTFRPHSFEKNAWEAGMLVCGVDEVGRGCLAGPLIVGAVILPPNTTYRLLKDSKILTEDERERAYKWITTKAWYTTSMVTPAGIDTHNIYQATLIAMRKAVLQLSSLVPGAPISTLLVDAMPLTLPPCPIFDPITIRSFPFGERYSRSIAAASIVAKVTRDRLMVRLEQSFPGYYLEQHKGYATNLHRKILTERSPSIIHRVSFISHMLPTQPEQQHMQIALFNEITLP